MLKKTENILAKCIEDIKAGRSSIEDCLEKYPYMGKKLKSLLQIALKIKETPDVKPSNAFKAQARVQLMEQISSEQAVIKWPWFRYSNKEKPILYKRRFSTMKLKMAAIFITIVFAISVLGVGTIYASQDSLPGDVLYPVKLGTERARLLTAANDIDRAERYLEIANIRIEEIGALAESEQLEKVDIAVNGYDEAIGMAIVNMNGAKAKGLGIDSVAILVDGATMKHMDVLEKVLERVPEQAKPAIERAMEMSIIGNERAAEALEEAGPPLEDGIPPGELPKPEEGTEEGITSEDKEESSDKAEGIKEKIKEKLENIIPQGKGTPLSQ